MKRLVLLGLVALAGVSAAAEPAVYSLPKELAAWVQAYTASRTTFDGRKPDYYADATKITQGQFGHEVAAAIVFTLEGVRGGNDYLQYLGLFWRRGDHYVFCCALRVGGKGIRSVDDVAFADDAIRISGKQYVAGTDAMCCPSKPYTADIRVHNAQLVDVQASNNRWRGP